MRHVAAFAVALAMTVGLAWLARAPFSPPGGEAAVLRLSWRMTVTAKENCRPRTQAELDALPVHMRTPEVCTRDDASYILVSRIDELPPDTSHLIRGGVKGDRPLFVLEDRTLEPGRHRVRIQLERTTAQASELLAAIDSTLMLDAGRVQLISWQEGTDRLRAR